MTDRELLELAAKAAGVVGPWSEWHQAYGDCWVSGIDAGGRVLWNPLTDDGDALRLAVTCDIDIQLMEDCVYVNGVEVQNYQLFKWHADDKCKATRHAIVRAAAEIERVAKGEA